MIDGATECGLLWASAALKCMGKGQEGWEELSGHRDEIECWENI